jgi:hypothetical protein
MRLSLRTLILSSAALCSTTVFAEATSQVQVDVPFNFVVKNHTYQAGTYRVAIEPARSLVTVSRIQSPVQSMMWIVGPADREANPHKLRLTFDTIGTEKVLRTIQFEGLTTQNLDAHSKHEVGAARIVGE